MADEFQKIGRPDDGDPVAVSTLEIANISGNNIRDPRFDGKLQDWFIIGRMLVSSIARSMSGQRLEGIHPDDKPRSEVSINLLRNAGNTFNLNPNQPALPILIAGTGTTGLPLIRRTGQPPVFSIQYLRRKASANSGLTYTPQFSSSLTDSGPAGWATATGTGTVESIDSEWERVTVEEDASGRMMRFGRVRVVSEE